MKHLVKFENYQSVNEELNWWQKLLAGASLVTTTLLPQDIYGQSKKGTDTQTFHKKTSYERTSKSLQKSGWQLDKVQTDTIWNEVQVAKPDTQLMTSTLHFDDAQYFASGKFILTQEMRDSILNELMEINNAGGVVTDIMIESSTDKQGLSLNLKNNLKQLGYTPDNRGLSNARCNSIFDFLTEQGVSDTIIQKNVLFEQGKGEIEQSARYVFVRFAYIVVDEVITPSESEMVPTLKRTYFLSKEVEPSKSHYKFRGGYKKVKKHGPLKNNKRKLNLKGVECTQPGL